MLRTSSCGGAGAGVVSEEASGTAALSLLWVLVCVFRLSGRVNERLQKGQVKSFFPEWEATCRRLALGSEKDLLQTLQSYGFSPLKTIFFIFFIFKCLILRERLSILFTAFFTEFVFNVII